MKKGIFTLFQVLAVLFGLISVPVCAQQTAEEGLEYLLFLEIPDVYVASRQKENADLAPSVLTVITAEEMKLRGVTTISEALQRVPGFYPSRQFFHDDLLGVRGYFYHTNDHLVMLLDGHNISRSGWTAVMTGDLDELMSIDKIERIEVVHGPGSVVWGDNAVLTVINVVTKNPADIQGTEVSVSVGSFDDSDNSMNRTLSIVHGYEWNEDVNLLVSLNLPVIEGWVSEDYSSWFRETIFPEARLDNFDNEFQSYEFFAKAKVFEWEIWYRVMNPHQNSTMHQYPNGTALVTDDLDFSLQMDSMVLNRKIEGSESLTTFSIAYDRYHFNGLGFGFGGTIEDSRIDKPFLVAAHNQDQNVLTAGVNFEYSGFANHNMVMGFEFVHQQYESARITPVSLDSLAVIPSIPGGLVTKTWEPGEDRTAMVYGQDTWKLSDSVNLIFGARAEWNDPRDDGDIIVTPRLAAVYHSNDDRFILKYMFNTGYHRPNWWQDQWPLGLFGTFDQLAGDSEISINHDVQMIWKWDRARLNLVVFKQEIQDIIASVPNAERTFKIWANSGDFESEGVELKLDVSLSDHLILGGNFTWTKEATLNTSVATFPEEIFNHENGRYLDYPEYQATLFLDILFNNDITANITYRYMTDIPGRELLVPNGLDLTSRSNGNSREVIVEDIGYLDLAFGVRNLLNGRLDVFLRGLNVIGDQDRIPQGQGDHDLYQPMPRYVELKGTWHFN